MQYKVFFVVCNHLDEEERTDCSILIVLSQSCADPESSVREGGPIVFFLLFLKLFSLDEGREDPNTTKSGPSLASQRSAI